MSGTFSPSSYLVGQGWSGPGTALKKGGLKKPVTVAHKTNLKGIGKERDTGYAWWDDVFSMVAKKKKNATSEQSSDIRKTSTGIYSPLPPSGGISGISTPLASAGPSGSAVFNTDIIGQAKLEAARRELYSKFLRGKPLSGTVDEKTVTPEPSTSAIEETEVDDASAKAQRKLEKTERKRLRAEKRERKETKRLAKARNAQEQEEAGQVDSAIVSEVVQEEPIEPQVKASKKRKRQAEVVLTETLGQVQLPTPPPSDKESEEQQGVPNKEERRAAKRARKEEKRRLKTET